MATRSLRRAGAELTITSFIVLFQELALIRWLGAEVRVLAYFPNVVLISAFLGLGVGAMRAGRRSLLWLWPASLAVVVAATLILRNIAFTTKSVSEHLWLLYYDIPNAPVVNDVRPPIVIAFVLSTLSFIALGQIVGDRLREFRDEDATLWGYVADLFGSLLGVIAFAAASFFGAFPIVWFGVFLGAGACLFALRGWRSLTLYAVAGGAIVFTIGHFERSAMYSPYYALRARPAAHSAGIQVLANGSLHQYAAPLAPNDVAPSEYDRIIRAGYPLPYLAAPRTPKRVLILGAGTGNDVVAALQAGAEHVDAVEIDPVILQIGRRMHPDHPYDSPRVRVINTDARAYLRNTKERYDLIVFGTLDSMTQLSALSNVRLDNFVYTVDSMKAARACLTPDGGVALYFMVGNPSIHTKLCAMLTEAFGEPPIYRTEFHELFNDILLAGPLWKPLRATIDPSRFEGLLKAIQGVDTPTDDWPYLYLEGRTPSSFYLSMLVLLLVISAATMRVAAPEVFRPGAFDAEMFLFGIAFLLLETKLVTQMTLVWGTTWVTSAVVFASILVTILLGTIAMQLRQIPFGVAATGLALSLIVTWAIPVEWLLFDNRGTRLFVSILFAGTPIVFSSICFAIRFRVRDNPGVAFGWNLAGAVCGGLLELLSMTTGIRAMTLVALLAYLVAFSIRARAEKQVGGMSREA
jgi:SAM-dependent methyltransferase